MAPLSTLLSHWNSVFYIQGYYQVLSDGYVCAFSSIQCCLKIPPYFLAIAKQDLWSSFLMLQLTLMQNVKT